MLSSDDETQESTGQWKVLCGFGVDPLCGLSGFDDTMLISVMSPSLSVIHNVKDKAYLKTLFFLLKLHEFL